MPDTCIIGAGITGLATAWQLQRGGHESLVLESAERVGGAMQTECRGGYLAEEGPNSILLNSAEIESFFESVPGLSEQIIEARPEANKRYIVRSGQPHAVPMNPLSAITTPLWSFAGKLRVLKEPFVRAAEDEDEDEESVAEFVRRRLGDELYRYAINPLVGGIYAGDPELLSLRHGFPKLYALEQEYGGLIRGALGKMRAARKSGTKFRKRMISFKDGMHALPATIARALGPAVQTGVSIESIRQESGGWAVRWTTSAGESRHAAFKQIILTVPAHRLSDLPLESERQHELELLKSIDYPPVSVLSLGYPRAQVKHPLDGFGALVPECEGRKVLGVLFPSSLFEGRAPKGQVLLTVFIGGERQPDCATPHTEALMGMVQSELEALLGVSGYPGFVHHKHWPKAIPQYKLGYGQYLKTIEDIEAAHPGLHLAGNYRTGISLSYCLEAAIAH
ncbi:protoporphyrinogen oxidase [Coraliomargarita parva]|uniref:protoporphyrinogen oxidase n=1 Tax=Coraliomargarita parva TaxID=3014050 RepID=UPI0022B3CE7C|nr:protoporphyrinogen oxidase [Coraliomargarita parva]